MIPTVIALSLGAVAFVFYDVAKNRHKLQYVIVPAPTIGSVRPPVLTQIGPITNIQGSPWMGGPSASSWSYAMNG